MAEFMRLIRSRRYNLRKAADLEAAFWDDTFSISDRSEILHKQFLKDRENENEKHNHRSSHN